MQFRRGYLIILMPLWVNLRINALSPAFAVLEVLLETFARGIWSSCRQTVHLREHYLACQRKCRTNPFRK